MNLNQATGKIYKIEDTRIVSEKFRVRELILETDTRWPQFVKFQVTQDLCESLDVYEVGHDISVRFRLKGREWTSPSGDVKFFNSLDIQSIDLIGERLPVQSGDDEIPF